MLLKALIKTIITLYIMGFTLTMIALIISLKFNKKFKVMFNEAYNKTEEVESFKYWFGLNTKQEKIFKIIVITIVFIRISLESWFGLRELLFDVLK